MQISTAMRKNMRSVLTGTSVSVAVLALLAACGGGGGTVAVAPTITLSGMAATGAPMAGATVVVKDSTDAEVQACAPCIVATDGKFSVELKTSAKKPFVLYVKQEGREEPEVSMIDTAASTTVNVTPITTLIAARLAADGDPAKLTASGLTSEKIAQAVAEVKLALQPLLTAAGVAVDANPLTMTFKADSTGLDKALDALGKVNITRSGDGKATVEVEIKMGGSDTAVNPTAAKITMASGSLPVPQGMSEQTLKSALPADNINVKIRGLMQRMQDCYGIAPADRRPEGAKVASEITGAVCKGLFVGNDPGKYLHNNAVVSQRGATLPADQAGRFTGAFSGIFGTTQGLTFDLPEYRYTITNDNVNDAGKPMNGDVVFTARWTVTDPKAGIYLGQTDVSEYQTRMEQGELKLVGNQSKHDLQINAQARREEMPAVSAYTYMATGYNINVTERRWDHDSNASTAKVSIYEQVMVTSPRGQVFTLKPVPGNNYDYLGLLRSSGATTSIGTVRLNAAYVTPGTTGSHPSVRFSKEYWANAADWTEEAIAAIPSQGNWKFDITLTDAFVAANAATGTVKNFTQYRRAINRAPTLTELQSVKWPVLKDPLKSALSAAATQKGYMDVGANNTPATVEIDGWEVPVGAWSPTTAKVYGTGWDEGLDIASTFRKATISCAGTGVHCEKSAGKNTGKFINAGWGYLQFFGRDSKRLQLSLNYSTRKTEADSN